MDDSRNTGPTWTNIFSYRRSGTYDEISNYVAWIYEQCACIGPLDCKDVYGIILYDYLQDGRNRPIAERIADHIPEIEALMRIFQRRLRLAELQVEHRYRRICGLGIMSGNRTLGEQITNG